jgi:eukaryotic-like serine/threonine-protein kinase
MNAGSPIPMGLAVGTRLGPYEVQSSLGAGGMGEVYKAKDIRLNRTVAIKVLPAALASDPQFRERFSHEARIIAQVDHPRICALYDVGEQDGTAYLVMQYLEGETLATRLERGALPLADALTVAIEIADALDKAHRAGIIHRDLKPGNVMLTKAGAKLLDFGVAKLRGTAPPLSMTDITQVAPPIAHGMVIGTVQYMAPEQVEGREADVRSDIFAFGAVMYEMVTGKRAFDGPSPGSVIGMLLKDHPPPLSTHLPVSPPMLDKVVATCLAKDPEDRWQTARDLVRELKWINEGARLEPAPAILVTRANAVGIVGWILAGVLLLGFVFFAIPYYRRPAAEIGVARFPILPPADATFPGLPSFLTVSPDGTHLAFIVLTADGKRQLWMRALDSLRSEPIAGTEGADQPFWSPDSRFVAFFADGKLRRVAISGGRPQTICETAPARSGTWNRDGVIIFTPGSGAGLSRVSAAGGTAGPLTKLDRSRGESDHLWPQFLPDGRRFVYLVRSSQAENTGIYVGSLDSEDRRLLLRADSNAVYAAPGYLLFQREGALMAQSFDPARAQLAGEALLVANDVGYSPANGRGAFAVSETGVMAYRSGLSGARSELAWFDRTGKRSASLDVSDANPDLWLSPDEQSVALSRSDQRTGTNIWLVNLRSSTSSRFTFDLGIDELPVWSPDGTHIVFAANRAGSFDLFRKASSGAGQEEVLLASGNDKYVSDWSRDGRFIAYYTPGTKGDFDLWILPLFGERRPMPFARTQFDERNARFSPDGRWIAYVSNESGRYEVYVQPFLPASGGKWQISTTGGYQPRWRGDGKELFFIAADGKVMSVSVETDGGLNVDVPKALFQTHLDPAALVNERNYAVTNDGQRLLITTSLGSSAPISVVLNWQSALGARDKR